MRHTRTLLAGLLVVALAAPATGCGSADGGSGYGSRDSTGEPPTATATTPEAPPGASARTCAAKDTGVEQLRVTGVGCDAGMRVVTAWTGDPSCSVPAGGSRFSCSVDDGYRCLGANAERGVAISCSRPGASVSFIAKAG